MQENHSPTPFFGITMGLLILATVIYGAVFQYRQGSAQIQAQSTAVGRSRAT